MPSSALSTEFRRAIPPFSPSSQRETPADRQRSCSSNHPEGRLQRKQPLPHLQRGNMTCSQTITSKTTCFSFARDRPMINLARRGVVFRRAGAIFITHQNNRRVETRTVVHDLQMAKKLGKKTQENHPGETNPPATQDRTLLRACSSSEGRPSRARKRAISAEKMNQRASELSVKNESSTYTTTPHVRLSRMSVSRLHHHIPCPSNRTSPYLLAVVGLIGREHGATLPPRSNDLKKSTPTIVQTDPTIVHRAAGTPRPVQRS